MCHEVFNRSAAQTYLHAAERERLQAQGTPRPDIPKDGILDKAAVAFQTVDWPRLVAALVSLLKRSRRILVIGLGLAGLSMAAGLVRNPNLWFHLLGKKLEYAFPEKAPAQYLIIMAQDIKCWSERNGRLDTPLEQYKVDSLGNVLFEKKKAARKTLRAVTLRAREWIEIRNDARGSSSHSIPLDHSSLAHASVDFEKGTLLDRHFTLSPRLAKGLPFLTPKFPAGALRHGRTWTEPIEWIDIYGEWKIHWSGTLDWMLGDLEPCPGGSCVQLTYRAHLRPQMWAWPDWAGKAVHQIQANVSGEGAALFDTGHQRLVFMTGKTPNFSIGHEPLLREKASHSQ